MSGRSAPGASRLGRPQPAACRDRDLRQGAVVGEIKDDRDGAIDRQRTQRAALEQLADLILGEWVAPILAPEDEGTAVSPAGAAIRYNALDRLTKPL